MLISYILLIALATSCMAQDRDWSQEELTFQSAMLVAHNTYRTRHDSPKLTLSKDLSGIAHDYAEHMALNNVFQESDNGYGENIYENVTCMDRSLYHPKHRLSTIIKLASDVVKTWYDEVNSSEYNYYAGEGNGLEYKHFTQVLWANSMYLGCGYSQTTYNDRGKICVNRKVVCNYFPEGNQKGEHHENVKLPN